MRVENDELKDELQVLIEFLIKKLCNDFAAFLIYKNRSYGASSILPINIFAEGEADKIIDARIDDKLKRIKYGKEYKQDDTIKDLTGYLILKMVNRELLESDQFKKLIKNKKDDDKVFTKDENIISEDKVNELREEVDGVLKNLDENKGKGVSKKTLEKIKDEHIKNSKDAMRKLKFADCIGDEVLELIEIQWRIKEILEKKGKYYNDYWVVEQKQWYFDNNAKKIYATMTVDNSIDPPLINKDIGSMGNFPEQFCYMPWFGSMNEWLIKNHPHKEVINEWLNCKEEDILVYYRLLQDAAEEIK